MTLEALLKRMASDKRRWSSPESFARTVVTLALRRFGFPDALEATAFVDGLGDLGIDGLALALGDEPLLEVADVDKALAAADGAAPVLAILFAQSKRPERIGQDDVILFGHAVKTFLTMTPRELARLRPSPQLKEQLAILEALRKARPEIVAAADVSMVFGYGGIWLDFAAVNLRREAAIGELQRALPGARFEFEIWGADHLVECGMRYGPAAQRKLAGVRLLELPDGPAPGYIGYVGAQGLVDFVSSPLRGGRGGRRRADDFMFDDNVRAFLGLGQRNVERENPGAVGLDHTLERGRSAEVVLGHNGIVIVADEGRLADGGAAVELTGAQVVNGCQTSHVLVARSGRLEGCWLPVKIVLTADEALKDMIAIASNTQAEVDSYDILARLPNVRALEPEFSRAAIALHDRVWFQRRRNEAVDFPTHWEGPDWSRVVRPRHLLDAFAAAIAGAPELAHGSTQATLDLARNGTAFHPEHDPTLYRALGWLVVTGRRWARRHGRNWQDRLAYAGPLAYPARHQYVSALWHLVDDVPEATGAADLDRSRPVQERFEAVIARLQEPDSGDRLGDLAGEAVDGAVPAERRLGYDLVRTKHFSELVVARARALKGGLAATDQSPGSGAGEGAEASATARR